MEKKLYGIYHVFDEDGGFGDAVVVEHLLFILIGTAEEANDYIKKWSRPYIYAKPYSWLETGRLEARTIDNVFTNTDIMGKSPMELVGENCRIPEPWLNEYSEGDLWKVENRPEGWEDWKR